DGRQTRADRSGIRRGRGAGGTLRVGPGALAHAARRSIAQGRNAGVRGGKESAVPTLGAWAQAGKEVALPGGLTPGASSLPANVRARSPLAACGQPCSIGGTMGKHDVTAPRTRIAAATQLRRKRNRDLGVREAKRLYREASDPLAKLLGLGGGRR